MRLAGSLKDFFFKSDNFLATHSSHFGAFLIILSVSIIFRSHITRLFFPSQTIGAYVLQWQLQKTCTA